MKVLELFSGIGGMHFAAKEAEKMVSNSALELNIVCAIDINTSANSVYKYNFPKTRLVERNIQSLSIEEINKMAPEIILMSPPCQPFTRTGLKKDIEDPRCTAFNHLLHIIPQIKSLKYILLENVKGFECSQSRDKFISMLTNMTFIYQEFLISPTQFDIPNSRTRYYLIAKINEQPFCFQNPQDTSYELMTSLPQIKAEIHELDHLRVLQSKPFKLKDIIGCLDETDSLYQSYSIPEKILFKRFNVFDIVCPDSKSTNCFTKAYSHYAEGTGSIFSNKTIPDINIIIEKCKQLLSSGENTSLESKSKRMKHDNSSNNSTSIDNDKPGQCNSVEEDISVPTKSSSSTGKDNIVLSQSGNENESSSCDLEVIGLLKSLNLRYFTPKEISQLMCFPNTFQFPKVSTDKSRYKLLGNSINVYVVAYFICLMVESPQLLSPSELRV